MVEPDESPLAMARGGVTSAWNALLTVYWANSPSWRLLKAGALLFMGFFLWAGSNVVLSYQAGWTPLQYVMAYGFLVLVYGPVHHLVVIPLAMRWRRASGTRQRLGKRLPNAGLTLFLVLVVVLGTFPPGLVVVDFTDALSSSTADIDPDLQCVKDRGPNGTAVHCHLTESRGVDSVVVTSSGERLLVDDEPPYEFTVDATEMSSVMGEKQFTVVLRAEDGSTIRRYTRRLSLIDRA